MTFENQFSDLALIGLQTGDEGKGKVVVHVARKAVDYLPQTSEEPHRVVVARWAGGANAGHTTISDGVTYKLHQLPSGIIVPRTYNLMAEGCFFNVRRGMQEIRELQQLGVQISPANFGIASNAHVTLDYHTNDDQADHKKAKHTSTGMGIKQTAVDKFGRVGIRFEEFLDRPTFVDFLRERRFPHGLPPELGDLERFADSYAEEREFLEQFSVLQTNVLTNPEIEMVIWEGAQGFRLDVDRGYYPGVTSSNPSIVPSQVAKILGVVKLYESSVGHDRPFVGQVQNAELEARLREQFGEFGTTTGLPRGIGWFDAVAVAHAVKSTQTDYLVGTCGDRLEYLAKINEPVRIVTAYKINGKTHTQWDKSFHNRRTLYRAEPVFEEFAPWDRFVDPDSRKIHPNAQRYLNRIQDLVGAEFVMLSHGPGEDDIIELKDPLTA
jgi:adenylosuccinate synthase